MRAVNKKISSRSLIGLGLHIGCPRREWSPAAERYLAGYRHEVSIFDLAQTSFHLRRAVKFVEKVISKYGRGFFYGFTGRDRPKAQLLAALGQVVSTERWSGGFVTNTRQFRGTVLNPRKIPNFVVCFRFETRNYSVLREKTRLKLPLICPIDSNSDPAYAEYPIPGSASNRANVGYLGQVFSKAAFSGFARRLRRMVKFSKNFRRWRKDPRQFRFGRKPNWKPRWWQRKRRRKPKRRRRKSY
jgi:ribosomal protein S2